MRAIWTGAVSFGLVNVPVKLYSATEDHDVSLHQVHDEDGGRIRYQRRCEVCGQVVPYANIDRAYVDDEETVVLTKEEMAALPQERSREISVVEFVPSDQIDPILFERSYYLAPTGKTTKAYELLRRTLESTQRTAIVQFALRQKTRLAALRVRGDVLTVQTLLWADEVREPQFPILDTDVKITSKEMQLSAALVKSFSSDFTPEDFRDEYQDELRKLIEAKLAQGDALDTEATFGTNDDDESDAEVIDLMEALRQSVQKSRAAKGRSSAGRGSKPRAKRATGSSNAKSSSASSSRAKPSRAKSTGAKSATAKSSTSQKSGAKSSKAKQPKSSRKSA